MSKQTFFQLFVDIFLTLVLLEHKVLGIVGIVQFFQYFVIFSLQVSEHGDSKGEKLSSN